MDLTLCYRAQDEGYLATIQMGTPPRDFLILMDSGSSDFWVGGEDCQTVSTTSAADNADNCVRFLLSLPSKISSNR